MCWWDALFTRVFISVLTLASYKFRLRIRWKKCRKTLLRYDIIHLIWMLNSFIYKTGINSFKSQCMFWTSCSNLTAKQNMRVFRCYLYISGDRAHLFVNIETGFLGNTRIFWLKWLLRSAWNDSLNPNERFAVTRDVSTKLLWKSFKLWMLWVDVWWLYWSPSPFVSRLSQWVLSFDCFINLTIDFSTATLCDSQRQFQLIYSANWSAHGMCC